jgi:NAD(P)-dependent dehydrogenase (short-subunit alcohol dehydrogenase family)
MRRLPIKRWGAPEEVARVIRFLVSEEASYVNGSLYTIDGGYSVS